MRSVLLAALAPVLMLSGASPALAQSEAQRDAETMAQTLGNPAMQDAIAGTMGTVMAAVLDMRIDGIAKALEPLNDGKRVRLPGKTVRDLVERDDPNFERKIEGGSRAIAGSMGAMAGAMAQMIPQLEAAMAKIERTLPQSR